MINKERAVGWRPNQDPDERPSVFGIPPLLILYTLCCTSFVMSYSSLVVVVRLDCTRHYRRAATRSVATIQGGIQINIVRDYATLHIITALTLRLTSHIHPDVPAGNPCVPYAADGPLSTRGGKTPVRDPLLCTAVPAA